MDPIFKKLNFKNHPAICVCSAPDSFAPQLEAMQEFTRVHTDLAELDELHFGLAFVTRQAEVDAFASAFVEKLTDDGLIWFAYPKGTSKRYKCEFNRDSGWEILGQLGFEGVRIVAIDEDWSALRFRRVEHIKTLTRSFAMSDEGKKRTGR
jgi:hypothetical protein